MGAVDFGKRPFDVGSEGFGEIELVDQRQQLLPRPLELLADFDHEHLAQLHRGGRRGFIDSVHELLLHPDLPGQRTVAFKTISCH